MVTRAEWGARKPRKHCLAYVPSVKMAYVHHTSGSNSYSRAQSDDVIRGIQYFLSAQLQLFATGFGLLILLLVFPGGLGQIFFSLRDRYLRRVATRRGVLVPSLVADRLADERIDTEAIFEATARTSAEELATTTGGSA